VVTLISYHNSSGEEGRCDAKCYNAEHPDCDCICGGRNQSAGREQALDNTRELGEQWLDHARQSGQVTAGHLSNEAMHQPLFSLPEMEAG
jgi:hypothetical protein